MPGIIDTLKGNETIRFLYNNSGLRHEVESGWAVIPEDTGKAWIRTVDNYGRDGTGPAGIGVLTRVIEKRVAPTPRPEPTRPAPAPSGQPGGNGGEPGETNGHLDVDDVRGHMTHDFVNGHLTIDKITGELRYVGPTEFTLKGDIAYTPDGAAWREAFYKENLMTALKEYFAEAVTAAGNDPKAIGYLLEIYSKALPGILVNFGRDFPMYAEVKRHV